MHLHELLQLVTTALIKCNYSLRGKDKNEFKVNSNKEERALQETVVIKEKLNKNVTSIVMLIIVAYDSSIINKMKFNRDLFIRLITAII